MKIAVVFNLKKKPEAGLPEDYYAEFDEIAIPRAIKAALEKNSHQAELLEADLDLFEKLRKGKFDFVFNIAEGIRGGSRESQVPAILDMLGIPYTGSGVLTQAITLDKTKAKEILLYHKIPSPRFQLFEKIDETLDPKLKFPMIVKPNAEGSSKGIKNKSYVTNESELREMVKFVIETYKQGALAEEFLNGREFTVAILGDQVLPIVEVTFDYLPEGVHKFDSYEVKWYWDNPNNPVDPVVCPAKIDQGLEKEIKETALKTFKALGCVDFCRMDIRLDDQGKPNIIDINALPGLIPDPKENSRFPKACFAAGMSYDEIINAILKGAVKRYENRNHL